MVKVMAKFVTVTKYLHKNVTMLPLPLQIL